MRTNGLRTVGGIGALLTCPCHLVPLVLLAGGTAGGVWLTRYLPLLTIVMAGVFLLSLWLLLRPDRHAAERGTLAGVAEACASCAPHEAEQKARDFIDVEGRPGHAERAARAAVPSDAGAHRTLRHAPPEAA